MDQTQVEKISELLALHGLNILIAALIFFVGRWATNIICNSIKKLMQSKKIDETLASFAHDLLYYGLMTFVVVAVLGRLGIQTASFVAVLGAAGFAVGLALQGSLSNFAAGVLIIIFRPFKVGDAITAGGASGVVKDIQIFNVVIYTADNVRVVVPNSQIMGSNIQNFSANDTRRVDLVYGISYKDDIAKSKQVIEQVLNEEKRVLKNPAACVAVLGLAESSVNFAVRPWVKNADYWDVYFALNEKIKLAFDKNGISIPYPTRDIHVISQPVAAVPGRLSDN